MEVASSSGSKKFTSLFLFTKMDASEFLCELRSVFASSSMERLSADWLAWRVLALAASLAGERESARRVRRMVDIRVSSEGFFPDVGERGAWR